MSKSSNKNVVPFVGVIVLFCRHTNVCKVPSKFVVNSWPRPIVKLSGVTPVILGLLITKSKVAFAAEFEEGVYPNSLALDTTFFLICAVSKNISDATILALNADV